MAETNSSCSEWQVHLGGDWVDLGPPEAGFLEDLFRRNQDVGELSIRGHKYRFCISAMTQTNAASGRVRAIRRISAMLRPGLSRVTSEGISGAHSVALVASEPALRIDVWLAGEWKKLQQQESEQILRRKEAGETDFEMMSRGMKYKVNLRQMTQTNVQSGRTRTIRIAHATLGSGGDGALGFEELRQRFRDLVKRAGDDKSDKFSQQVLTERHLRMGWPSDQSGPLLDLTVGAIINEMDLRRNKAVDMVEWNHYWALERDSVPFHAGNEVNVKLSEALAKDPQVLGRMQMHFEAASAEDADLRASSSSSQATWDSRKGRLSSQGLLRACERLVDSPKDVIEKKWAQEVLEQHHRGEGVEEDADLSYYDFLNVMLGRKRFKVTLYLYDISDGIARRWSWLLLGQHLEGIWHSGIVIEWPDRKAEFWFGGSLFESIPGTTPFGTPLETRALGYTYKLHEEVWDYICRVCTAEFTKSSYDVLTHNCNHFSDKLSMYVQNQHIPDDVLKQPDRVMSTMLAQALRPMLNRWLGGFDALEQSRVTDSAEIARFWKQVLPTAIVEFAQEEAGRPLIGQVVAAGADECTMCNLDFWSHEPVTQVVPRALVTKILRPPQVAEERAEPSILRSTTDPSMLKRCIC